MIIFLPDVHVSEWVNLDSKTDKIKRAHGSLTLALGFGTQSLALPHLKARLLPKKSYWLLES